MWCSLAALLVLAAAAGYAPHAVQAAVQAACGACHGAHGEGSQALGAPPIAGQDAAYLARQLANFKSGKRGYHPDDKGGAGMRAVANALK